MKYKTLKSAAHNFGHSFASGLNWRDNDYVMTHLARAVVASGEVELDVDLLSGQARPAFSWGRFEGPWPTTSAGFLICCVDSESSPRQSGWQRCAYASSPSGV